MNKLLVPLAALQQATTYIRTSHFQVGSPKAVPETAAMVPHFALPGGVCKVPREQGAPLGL